MYKKLSLNIYRRDILQKTPYTCKKIKLLWAVTDCLREMVLGLNPLELVIKIFIVSKVSHCQNIDVTYINQQQDKTVELVSFI